MKIQNVTDASFKTYGRVHEGYVLSDIQKEMQHTPLPREVVYVPSVEEMEGLSEAERLKNQFFGELPIQIGYCNGYNKGTEGLCSGCRGKGIHGGNLRHYRGREHRT